MKLSVKNHLLSKKTSGVIDIFPPVNQGLYNPAVDNFPQNPLPKITNVETPERRACGRIFFIIYFIYCTSKGSCPIFIFYSLIQIDKNS